MIDPPNLNQTLYPDVPNITCKNSFGCVPATDHPRGAPTPPRMVGPPSFPPAGAASESIRAWEWGIVLFEQQLINRNSTKERSSHHSLEGGWVFFHASTSNGNIGLSSDDVALSPGNTCVDLLGCVRVHVGIEKG